MGDGAPLATSTQGSEPGASDGSAHANGPPVPTESPLQRSKRMTLQPGLSQRVRTEPQIAGNLTHTRAVELLRQAVAS